ncbi:unnamed protein product [Phyllotreta striolata]|uniref:CRC domain-containing protein n=1 Tax=Phyllotreta striolata TaxID=444603 RepID=A0A9N9XM08_PHYSR|nr:unnamed protein product [Phyllotreta striolata]
MSFSEKVISVSEEDVENAESLNIENAHLDSSISSFSGSEIQNLSDISQELTLNATDMETEDHEIIVENQEIIGHEEEVEMEEIVNDYLEVALDSPGKPDEQLLETKPIKTVSVPPLRPLTIAPKPAKVPLAVKSIGGQPVLLLQGAGTGQTIKLVSPQGQELNLTNLVTRPITVKPTLKTLSTGGNISLVQQKPLFMKKVMATSPKQIIKPATNLPKQSQHFMVVQKNPQQQLKLLQTQGIVQQTPAKTLTLQQAQEMGLLTNAKIAQAGQSSGKQTILLNKTAQKSIKFVPQIGQSQMLVPGSKTITLNQVKSPAKILPASSLAAAKPAQRIIFKTAGGNQTIIPQGQILQLSGTQNLNTGQLHQINIPGKGMQYIKFVTASASDVNAATGNVTKTSTGTPTSIVLSEVKPNSPLNRIVPKMPKDKIPIASNKSGASPPLLMIPANAQLTPVVSKVAIAPPPPKHVPAVKTAAPSLAPPGVAVGVVKQEEVDANGMRPRKPCNCNKSQCLKLYCDCFANGEFCYMCNCVNCNNNIENEDHRNRAIKACLERNPHAFRPKIGKAKDTSGDTAIRKHTKGCNCKRSGCLKNYCECYEAKIACSSNCKCVGCRNIEDSFEKKNFRHVIEKATNTPVYDSVIRSKSSTQARPRRSSSSRKQTINFITDDVIEATCQCLLTISDNAEESMQGEEVTKRLIIEEFGRCLTEIIDCSSSRNFI